MSPIENVNQYNSLLKLVGLSLEEATIIADFAMAAATVFLAVFAYKGLKTWRYEMQGRRNAGIAEEVLADFYQAQAIYEWVRSPGAFSSESEGRTRTDDENDDLARVLDGYFIPIDRLHREHQFLSDFYTKKHRFRAVFGEAACRPFQTLRDIDARIVTAANMLSMKARMNAWRPGGAPPDERSESVIWGVGPEDEINRELREAVDAIEKICRPAIEARKR